MDPWLRCQSMITLATSDIGNESNDNNPYVRNAGLSFFFFFFCSYEGEIFNTTRTLPHREANTVHQFHSVCGRQGLPRRELLDRRKSDRRRIGHGWAWRPGTALAPRQPTRGGWGGRGGAGRGRGRGSGWKLTRTRCEEGRRGDQATIRLSEDRPGPLPASSANKHPGHRVQNAAAVPTGAARRCQGRWGPGAGQGRAGQGLYFFGRYSCSYPAPPRPARGCAAAGLGLALASLLRVRGGGEGRGRADGADFTEVRVAAG